MRDDYPDFYKDWEIFKSRILLEDPYVTEESTLCTDGETTKTKPLPTKVTYSLPIYNRYKLYQGWASGTIHPIGQKLATRTASLNSSIATLDSFFATECSDDIAKVKAWLEIILTFENGSGFVTAEAKAKLKEDGVMLDQERLISNWWLLSYLYLSINT